MPKPASEKSYYELDDRQKGLLTVYVQHRAVACGRGLTHDEAEKLVKLLTHRKRSAIRAITDLRPIEFCNKLPSL